MKVIIVGGVAGGATDRMRMLKLLCLKDPDTYPMRIVGFHIISET